MRFLDTQGRVERFSMKRTAAAQTVRKSKKKSDKKEENPLSLRDMLEQEKKKLVSSKAN